MKTDQGESHGNQTSFICDEDGQYDQHATESKAAEQSRRSFTSKLSGVNISRSMYSYIYSFVISTIY